jgi:hypothetical protein
MGRYDSIKHPYQYRMSQWAAKKTNDHQEKQAKSIPCHVTKVDKDFIYVAFENQNSISTLPTVKIPQSWSQYSREPTQVGDKGYAVPGNYYLGGATDDSGGNTDFYPRGNLTTLSFNGVSHKKNPSRDYDQLTHMGGPNGWIVGAHQKQQQDQQQQQQQNQASTSLALSMRTSTFRAQEAKLRKQLNLPANLPSTLDATTSGTSSTSGGDQQQGQQQNDDKTQFSFDKDGKAVVQSKDTDHVITVDQKNKKITIKVPTDHVIYVGGDGTEGQYDKLLTKSGPVINAKGRIS